MAATDSGTLDGSATDAAVVTSEDAALAADGGGSSQAGAHDASDGVDATTPDSGDTVRTPVFQPTHCIDPSQVLAGTEHNFPRDGVDIWVSMPSACQTRACGLIFNIHGGGMNDHATMDQATNMIALGNQADYLVVHPHKGTWDVANERTTLFELMQLVIAAFDIDTKRVHSKGKGYSQGGQLS